MTIHTPSDTEIGDQFLEAMQTRALTLSQGAQLVGDGQWHRCDAANKPNGNDDGTYKLYLDGPAPWGLFHNWTDGKGVDAWRGKLARALTEDERRDLERRLEQQRAEHEKEAAALAVQAAEKASGIWSTARPAPADHPYLARKQVETHGLRVIDHDRLLVPMHDPDGNLVNLQFIADDGSKWFLKGGRTKGCYFPIDGAIDRVIVTEGFATGASIQEATGASVIVAFSAGNLLPVAASIRGLLTNIDAKIWKRHQEVAEAQGLQHERRRAILDAKLVIAADDDWKTKDNPGFLAAIKAARAAHANMAAPSFEGQREDGDTDFNDLACRGGQSAVVDNIAKAVDPHTFLREWVSLRPHTAHRPLILNILADLKRNEAADYEEILASLKRKGVRHGELDRAVKASAKMTGAIESDGDKAADLYPHWSIEPWPESVETGELLEAIKGIITRYVATLGSRAVVPALWIMFTYVHENATHSPLLLATSPEPESGKTTLLDVIGFLAKRSLPSVSISGAALFRSLESWLPTFIVDEADKSLINNVDLREVVNSGWTRGQGVIRCDSETHEPRRYSSFAPKAIGMKGKELPDTTLSRAIIIEMKRKQPGEVVEDFDHLDNEEFATLR